MTIRSFFTSAGVALVVGSILIASHSGAAAALVLLQDNFNDNSIDASKWSVVTAGIPLAFGAASVTETGQRIRLQGRGHLNSAQNFAPGSPGVGGLKITGTWTFGSDDFLQILTRSSGTASSPWGETTSGIEMFAHTGNNQLQWNTRGSAIISGGTSVVLPHGIDLDDVFSFEFTDDGFNLRATLTEVGNPLNTGTITGTSSFASATNLITFHNREASTKVAYLDNVLVTSLNRVPEPDSAALALLAIVALGVCRRRKA